MYACSAIVAVVAFIGWLRHLPGLEVLMSTVSLAVAVMVVREIWGANHRRILDVAAACSDADLSADERGGVGDPTEIAIVVAAAERGIRRREIEAERSRRSVHPFDADRKLMSIYRADDVLYVKGAVEALVQRARIVPYGALDAASDMAARGLRLFSIIVISVLVQLSIHHIPATQELFGIRALAPMDCLLSLAIGTIPLVVLEIGKVLRRMFITPRSAST